MVKLGRRLTVEHQAIHIFPVLHHSVSNSKLFLDISSTYSVITKFIRSSQTLVPELHSSAQTLVSATIKFPVHGRTNTSFDESPRW